MKYNVGDRVRIKSIDWYNENKDINEEIQCGDTYFVGSMTNLCGLLCTIGTVNEEIPAYHLLEDTRCFCWTDEMFEGLVEEEVGLVDELSSRWVNEFNLPNGYIFKDENGNVINAQKIVLEKKKKEYPKTYEECCKVLRYAYEQGITMRGVTEEEGELFRCLIVLKRCRDAYWKIAGEEMGLGKPWKPDWSIYVHKFCLGTDKDKIIKEYVTTGNRILTFPTKEMRDAFYENFKELIEQCKELL